MTSLVAICTTLSRAVEETLDTRRLYGRDGLPIHARGALVRSNARPRLPEDVTPPDPVMQGVESPRLASPGRLPESALEFLHLIHGGYPVGSWPFGMP